MLYTFTAFIDGKPFIPGRVVVATAQAELNDMDKAQIFARGFAWQVYQVKQVPIDVGFRAEGSEFTSWAFCPVF